MNDPLDSSQTTHGEQAFRRLLERFARVRAAHRALPDSAEDLLRSEQRERFASGVRNQLKQLGALSKSGPETGGTDLESALADAGRALKTMEFEVLKRVDETGFEALRASIPSAAEAHRAEVVSLLETIALSRERLLERLSKLEYLLTILCTEENDGQRRIVHDPASITPVLGEVYRALDLNHITEDSLNETVLAIHQSASVEDLGDDPKVQLRQVRKRKDALGLGRLTPDMLRAVLTYNTRIFNIFSSSNDPARASDTWIEQLLGDATNDDCSKESDEIADSLDTMEDVWERIGNEPTPGSVFESPGVSSVIDAFGRRLRQIPIGSCASERVALALDLTRLEDAERVILVQKESDDESRLVRHTVIVGLILRDLGAVSSYLDEIGICTNTLSRHWVLELNEQFRAVLSPKLSDPEQYANASRLSGIKTKHLLAPISALKTDEVSTTPTSERASPSPLPTPAEDKVSPTRSRSRSARRAGLEEKATSTSKEMLRSLAQHRIPLAACAAMLIVTFLSWASAPPPNVATLSQADLASASPYLESAYRNKQGRGGMMFGKLEPSFATLPPKEQTEAAEAMVPNLASAGVREAMFYDRAGRLLVHYSSGVLRRPLR